MSNLFGFIGLWCLKFEISEYLLGLFNPELESRLGVKPLILGISQST
jgi:hypothetical protein